MNNNSLTANQARGIVIDAYGASVVGATVNDNTLGGHLDDRGLDVKTGISGTTLCLAASGNNNNAGSDQIVLEEVPGSALTVTGVADIFALSAANNDMPVATTGGVAYTSCTP